VLGIEKESAECGCSVKTITSKGPSSKLTLASTGENTECIPAVRETATSSSSNTDHDTKRSQTLMCIRHIWQLSRATWS